jgi:hypothetical protein
VHVCICPPSQFHGGWLPAARPAQCRLDWGLPAGLQWSQQRRAGACACGGIGGGVWGRASGCHTPAGRISYVVRGLSGAVVGQSLLGCRLSMAMEELDNGFRDGCCSEVIVTPDCGIIAQSQRAGWKLRGVEWVPTPEMGAGAAGEWAIGHQCCGRRGGTGRQRRT